MTIDETKARLILELRKNGILDKDILDVMELVPRELFIPETFQDHAYEDAALPIARGQTISQPYVVAKMTQALEMGPRMKVLEIGTGSGYQSVILSHFCRRVYSIERHRPLLKGAESMFLKCGRYNITAKIGDGSLGWPEQAPFERILVTAAAADIPPVLTNQLAIGGIMVVPVGDQFGVQNLVKVHKTEHGLDVEDLGAVRFVPLVGGIADD